MVWPRSIRGGKALAMLVLAVGLMLIAPPTLCGGKKKKAEAAAAQQPAPQPQIDISKLVWPSPPAIPRIRYLGYYAGMKIDRSAPVAQKKKASWMDRMAGSQPKDQQQVLKEFPFQLIGPYGIAIDSKGLVYVADQRVGAVFIFNTETRDVQLIRNGYEAHLQLVNGLAIDDGDRLFVSDGKLRRVLVFNSKHVLEGQIAEGLVDPVGLAIDTENRLLYVVDTQQDQVIVYDADSWKLLRRIGTGGKDHVLTTPGDFGAPSNVAVDKDGNVYVTDTMNDRVEIFDADGNFLSTFGQNGDGPGYFARPKGIAVDCDGHIWVADAMQDRVQVFNREGELLAYLGGHGNSPGQFKALVGIAVDKQNRVFTTEQYPGRMQMFRYVTDAEAEAEKKRREAEREAAAAAARQGAAAEKSATAATGQKDDAIANPSGGTVAK